MTTAEQTVAAQAQAMIEGAAAQLPVDVLRAITAEQRRLTEEGVPAGVATPGTRVPDVPLLDVHARPTTLVAARAGRACVVVFYRGAWCPYCNIALRTYQAELLPELTARGIGLVAVSPQRPDGSLTTAEAAGLSYTVVSDPGNTLAAALGVLSEPGDGAKEAMRTLGTDLTEVNADGTWSLPMPTTLLLDGDGVLRWIDVHPNYAERTEVADILAAVAGQLG